MGLILLIVLFLFFFAALPTWPYSRQWRHYPATGLGLLWVVILVLVIFAIIPWRYGVW